MGKLVTKSLSEIKLNKVAKPSAPCASLCLPLVVDIVYCLSYLMFISDEPVNYGGKEREEEINCESLFISVNFCLEGIHSNHFNIDPT